jgi:hypothetical protein
MKPIALVLLALAIAIASAQGIDISISASPGIDINVNENGLDENANVWINGKMWNRNSEWMDEDGSLFKEIFHNGKLHEKSIIWINGTQVITMMD